MRALLLLALLAAGCSKKTGAVFDTFCNCALADGGITYLLTFEGGECDQNPDELANNCRQHPAQYLRLDAGCVVWPDCACNTSVAPDSWDCGT